MASENTFTNSFGITCKVKYVHNEKIEISATAINSHGKTHNWHGTITSKDNTEVFKDCKLGDMASILLHNGTINAWKNYYVIVGDCCLRVNNSLKIYIVSPDTVKLNQYIIILQPTTPQILLEVLCEDM